MNETFHFSKPILQINWRVNGFHVSPCFTTELCQSPHHPSHEEHASFVGTKGEIHGLWKNNSVVLIGSEEKDMCNFGWGCFIRPAMAWKPKTGLSYGTGAWSLGGESTVSGNHSTSYISGNEQATWGPGSASRCPRCLGKYFSKCTLILKTWRCMVEVTWSTSPDP